MTNVVFYTNQKIQIGIKTLSHTLNIYVPASSLSNHIGCNAVVSSSIIFGYISNGQYISFDDRRLHTICIFG